MPASLEELGLLPRPQIAIKVIDRATVRSIVNAERDLVDRAGQLGFDIDEAHRGYAPYIEGLMHSMSNVEKQEFQRLLVEETLNDDRLEKALAGAAEAERKYAEVLLESAQPKPPSTARVFMAGVNLTIICGLVLYWILK